MTNRPAETSSGSRADGVARQIEDMIAAKGLRSGHRLGTKESLRAEYDVAVATFNEAVRLLSARKAITIRPGVKGGIFVASPPVLVRLGRKMLELSGDSVSVADCLVVRDALEPLIAADAARYRNTPDIEDLRRLAEGMCAEGLDEEGYLRANWSLHRRIALITPNQFLQHTYVSMLEFVESRLEGVTSVRSSMNIAEGALVHRELVEAIASSDQERTTIAVREHEALTQSRDA
jgi:DNA-binding FadR family transcriptional regulator